MYHVYKRNIELMIILNTLYNKLHSTISADYIYFSSDIIIQAYFLLGHYSSYLQNAQS